MSSACAVSELTAAGKQVFLAEVVPDWVFDPARVSIVQAMPLRMAVERAIEPGLISNDGIGATMPRNDLIDRLVLETAANNGAHFLELATAFCTAGICRYRDGEDLLYVNNGHLSPHGAIHALSAWVGVLFNHSAASVEPDDDRWAGVAAVFLRTRALAWVPAALSGDSRDDVAQL
jgi:SGNH domain (fused to AT3 domains)